MLTEEERIREYLLGRVSVLASELTLKDVDETLEIISELTKLKGFIEYMNLEIRRK